MTEYISPNHRQFLIDLRSSYIAVEAMAKWLRAKGYTVEIPKPREAPTAADHALYSDDGDMFIVKDGIRERVEVKFMKSTPPFVDRWPYPHVFITRASRVHRSEGQVSFYALVSCDLKHVAIVNCNTREQWYPKKFTMKNTGNEEEVYCCHPDVPKFYPLEV